MTEEIGFIGLGALGLPMANNLLDSGYALRVYNRTASKAQTLVARGAELAATPAETARPGGMVASIVWDGAALEEVVTSEGFLERLAPGGIHIGMATVAPETSRKIATLHAEHDSVYVEAAIFGGSDAAAARQLWIPFAGPTAAKERVRPLLQAMGSQGVFDFGEQIGAATLVKIIGNYLIFSASRSLYEGLTLARQSGVDPQAVVAMLTQTLFAAPIYQRYGQAIAGSGQIPHTRSRIPQKDILLFEALASQVGAPTPIANLLESLIKSSTSQS
jgi:3-hydroxyisobutyrate dehydrogenase-like beta-hydroxyacid dehydrogenase